MIGMLRRLALVAAALALGSCAAPSGGPLGPAPAFDLPALGGGTISLASLKGKVVVLDFWATWCGPCLKELPEYAQFWRKNRPRGVEVVGVVIDSGEPEEIRSFVQDEAIPYPQVLGDDKVALAYGATDALPTTFVISADGTLRRKLIGGGPGKFETLQKIVDEALALAPR